MCLEYLVLFIYVLICNIFFYGIFTLVGHWPSWNGISDNINQDILLPALMNPSWCSKIVFRHPIHFHQLLQISELIACMFIFALETNQERLEIPLFHFTVVLYCLYWICRDICYHMTLANKWYCQFVPQNGIKISHMVVLFERYFYYIIHL